MFLRLQFLLCVLFPFGIQGICQSDQAFAVSPPINTYTHTDHDGGTQNWMIDQSEEGNIYIANNEGLLSFDGARWQLFPTYNQTVMRSVNVIGDAVYTGCYMDFGYWKKNQFGVFQYTSLTGKLPEPLMEDEQIWNIHESGKWVIFQSLNHIYLYNSESQLLRKLEFPYGIVKSFDIKDEIYFQSLNHGLYQIINGNYKLINNSEIIKGNIITGMHKKGNSILAITENADFIYLNNGRQIIKEFNYYDPGVKVYSASVLENENIALGTISHGLLISDFEGNLIDEYNTQRGLSNNTVLSILEDNQKTIWLGLDDGISAIHRASVLRTYSGNQDLGAVYTCQIFEENLYLGTNQGLYYRPWDQKNNSFRLVPGSQEQVWSLCVFEEFLLCGHARGTLIVKDNRIVQSFLDNEGAWGFKRIPGSDNLFLAGTYYGLYVFELLEDQWVIRNKIGKFDRSSKFFEFVDQHHILVSHEYKGVFHIKINSDFSEAIEVYQDTSVEKGQHAGLIKHKNEIYYSKLGGVWQYDRELQTFVQKDFYTPLQSTDQYVSGKMVSENGLLWIFTEDFVHAIAQNNFDGSPEITSIPLTQSYRTGIAGYENVKFIGDGTYLLGSTKGYHLLNLQDYSNNSINLRFTDVSYIDHRNNLLVPISFQIEQPIKLKHFQNTIKLHYTKSTYDPLLNFKFQTKLNNQDWEPWQAKASTTLEQLPPGKHRFLVRSLLDGEEAKQIMFEFEILKPWYLTNLAWLIYITGALGFAFFVNQAYAAFYRKQQEKLIEDNKRAMAMLEMEAQQQLTELKNERLRLEVENKNRELGISTMYMAKQNEILGAIKSELSSVNKLEDIPKVINKIDKDLDPSEDWKMFEKAFNEADNDFFKKVKGKHPKLTTSDLKLCAYLRLNMSSKEIAPLLQISTRSVEIKRYRLRKKLQLEEGANLVEYFLSL